MSWRAPSSCLSAVLLLVAACGEPPQAVEPTPTPTPVSAAQPDAPPVADAPRFVEVAQASGIVFEHFHGGTGEKNFIETMGGGVALLDIDADGDLDAYLVQSGALPGQTSDRDGASHLFQNRGDGSFERVTAGAGVDNPGSYGMGVAAADYDNDGLVDIYVTNFEGNRLYHNLGAGRFEDVTEMAAVADPLWSVSAVWGDYDADGLLDLYVVNYIDFTMDNNKWCGRKSENIRAYCHPDQYNGVQPRLYMNRGDGTFADQTEAAGMMETVGKGLGGVASDFDDDGDIDLFGANDSTINYVWRNRGDGTFEDYSLISGAGYNEDGKPQACMGADAGDYNRDGKFDVYTTNLDLEYNTLYRNNATGNSFSFIDSTYPTGLAESHLLYVGFGTEFFDYDFDGLLDLVIGNGHIIDNVAEMNDSMEYRQPKSLFRNIDGEHFVEVSAGIAAFNAKRVSRGLAVGDIDGDGDLDILVGNNGEPAELLRDDSPKHGNFVVIETEGRRSNRQGIGAKLTLEAGGMRQIEEVRAGTSYATSTDPRVTFGLGTAAVVDSLEVRWPSGEVQRFGELPANRWIKVIEGQAEPIVTTERK